MTHATPTTTFEGNGKTSSDEAAYRAELQGTDWDDDNRRDLPRCASTELVKAAIEQCRNMTGPRAYYLPSGERVLQ